MVRPGGEDDGYVYLRTGAHGINRSPDGRIYAVQAHSSNNPAHLWRFVPVPGQTRWYRIQNRATGNILDHYYGSSVRVVANLTEHPNHLWEVLPDMTGNYYHIVNKATGGVLGVGLGKVDVFSANISIGAGVYNAELDFQGVWDALSWSWGAVAGAPRDHFNLVNAAVDQGVDY